jgi:phenylpropionate dioxygenase-like ring-hydroxylating dioxygenase large terminal subunit
VHAPSTSDTARFNRSDVFAVGWYWVLASGELPPGAVRSVVVQGRSLVAWRGRDGRPHVMDAQCPHMGAHLGEGKVEGDGLRCFFHAWKFDGDGACVDVPCQARPASASVRAWPVAERYGMLWVWTGATPQHAPASVPDLGDADPGDVWISSAFQKACHPNVVMVNAIDAQHFNSVHDLPARLEMAREDISSNAVNFANTVPPREDTRFGRFLRRFYAGPITYSLRYWFGSTGCVTLGPDVQHFHILFALRMAEGGVTEGRTICVTRRRPGLWGRVVSAVMLGLTRVVGAYFADGDTRVFRTIRFDFRTPIKADHAIIGFIKHYEAQPAAAWGTWEPLPSVVPVAGASA